MQYLQIISCFLVFNQLLTRHHHSPPFTSRLIQSVILKAISLFPWRKRAWHHAPHFNLLFVHVERNGANSSIGFK